MAESWSEPRRTRWAKRRQSILEAVGVTAPPEVLVQLREAEVADAEGFNAPEGNTSPAHWQAGGGPPESTGRGMQEERRQRTWEAPSAPVQQGGGGVLSKGKPAGCQWGVLSRLGLGAWESHVHGEGRDGRT